MHTHDLVDVYKTTYVTYVESVQIYIYTYIHIRTELHLCTYLKLQMHVFIYVFICKIVYLSVYLPI